MKIDEILLVGDYREKFPNLECESTNVYNDHFSLNALKYVENALKKLNIKANYFGGIDQLIASYRNNTYFSDNTYFFNLSDGLEEDNRKAQAPILLELLKVKYIGSDANASLIAANKAFSKLLVKQLGINTPNGKIIYSIKDLHDIALNYPLIIKPNREGSSIGIFKDNYVVSYDKLFDITKKLLINFNELIVEEYIEGFEITNFLIGNTNKFLFNQTIISGYKNNYYLKNTIFGMHEKANGLRQQTLAENILPKPIVKKVQDISEKIFNLLGVKDFARVDFRVDKNYNIYFIEINTIPVISSTSEIGLLCKLKQITPESLINNIISTAYCRWK